MNHLFQVRLLQSFDALMDALDNEDYEGEKLFHS